MAANSDGELLPARGHTAGAGPDRMDTLTRRKPVPVLGGDRRRSGPVTGRLGRTQDATGDRCGRTIERGRRSVDRSRHGGSRRSGARIDPVSTTTTVAVDIGATKTVVAVGRGGTVEPIGRFATDRDPSATVEAIATTLQSAGLPRGEVRIGVGCPGPLDPISGTIIEPPNLPGWWGFPLADALGERTGATVLVQNDANLGALGEARFGSGRDAPSLYYITLSTGIGAGYIVDGRIIGGYNGLAGEVWALDSATFVGAPRGETMLELASGPRTRAQRASPDRGRTGQFAGRRHDARHRGAVRRRRRRRRRCARNGRCGARRDRGPDHRGVLRGGPGGDRARRGAVHRKPLVRRSGPTTCRRTSIDPVTEPGPNSASGALGPSGAVRRAPLGLAGTGLSTRPPPSPALIP